MQRGHYGIDVRRVKGQSISVPQINALGPPRQRQANVPSNGQSRPRSSYSRSRAPSAFSEQPFELNGLDPAAAFDEMISKTREQSLHEAVESTMSEFFNAESVVLWIYDPSTKTLFSPSKVLTVMPIRSIVGAVYISRTGKFVNNPATDDY
jgi:hypothetical protein